MSVQLCSVYLTSETFEFSADIKMLLTLRIKKKKETADAPFIK